MNPLDQWWNSSGLSLRGMPRMGLKWSACLRIIIKHKRTRPYRLQANDKAERFIRTTLKERAYAQAYTRSRQGTGYLPIRGHTAYLCTAAFGSWWKSSSFIPGHRVNSVLTLYN